MEIDHTVDLEAQYWEKYGGKSDYYSHKYSSSLNLITRAVALTVPLAVATVKRGRKRKADSTVVLAVPVKQAKVVPTNPYLLWVSGGGRSVRVVSQPGVGFAKKLYSRRKKRKRHSRKGRSKRYRR